MRYDDRKDRRGLTTISMSCKLQYMERVSIRELQQNIKRVLERVEQGETVEVTRRRRTVARLSPIRQPRKAAGWPDLEKRAREVLGDRILAPGAGAQILSDRGRW